jgi:hypothetical protein
MALESATSTSGLASSRGRSTAQRGADYFGMSGPAEFVAAASLFALMIALKLVNMTRYRFDSDESQHMHDLGVGARVRPIRDVFDNPLFRSCSRRFLV